MNSEFIGWHGVNVTVTGYEDGIYNLEMRKPPHSEGDEVLIEISENGAERVCELLGEDLPNPEPTKPVEFK